MTKLRMTQEYFDWMCHLVGNKKGSRGRSWQMLLGCLNEHNFVPMLDMDQNRADDGTDLRYRFAYEKGYTRSAIAAYLDDGPCSVLEVMVALALRCEEHIMGDPAMGDRTGLWFWEMVHSMGLSSMDDDRFDPDRAIDIITRFNQRTYQPNGKGGLFTVNQCPDDLRELEIWYQMMRYLNTYLEN